jgi:hypothetical protein
VKACSLLVASHSWRESEARCSSRVSAAAARVCDSYRTWLPAENDIESARGQRSSADDRAEGDENHRGGKLSDLFEFGPGSWATLSEQR